ncbi:TniQ family protein [Paraburkholderia tagetis]|uniref:TniQ family protein n=1 Tax=Paraburkholderia tagetis TaxID=2913261 RepID=UPI003B75BA8F
MSSFFSVTPKFEESLGGFLIRVCQENPGLTTGRILRSVFGKWSKPASAKAGKLAEFCRADPMAVAELSGYWRQAMLSHEQYRCAGHWIEALSFIGCPCSAICPICLIEAPYSRAEWDISLYACCPVHGVSLLETCPSCSRSIGLNRQEICRCRCGYDFRRALMSNPSAPSLEIATGLDWALWGEDARTKELKHGMGRCARLMDSEGICALLPQLWFLGITLPALTANVPLRGSKRLRRQQVDSVAGEVVDVLNGWPDSFLERINQLYRNRYVSNPADADRVLRYVWRRTQDITAHGDPLNLRRVFVQAVGATQYRRRKQRCLRVCTAQMELDLEEQAKP